MTERTSKQNAPRPDARYTGVAPVQLYTEDQLAVVRGSVAAQMRAERKRVEAKLRVQRQQANAEKKAREERRKRIKEIFEAEKREKQAARVRAEVNAATTKAQEQRPNFQPLRMGDVRSADHGVEPSLFLFRRPEVPTTPRKKGVARRTTPSLSSAA